MSLLPTFQTILPGAGSKLPIDSAASIVSSGMSGEGAQNSLTAPGLMTGGLIPNDLGDAIAGSGSNLIASASGIAPVAPTNGTALNNLITYGTPNPVNTLSLQTASDGSFYTVPPNTTVVAPYKNSKPPVTGITKPINGAYLNFGEADEKIYIYSGSDMRVMLEMANTLAGIRQKPKQLIELHTLSVSVYRVKTPVRACGYINPKAFSRGTRTIGGTMVLTPFTVDVLYRFLLNGSWDKDTSEDSQYNKPDQLPPFNLTLMFADEYGNVSHRRLLGVDMSTDGMVYSQNDMFSEQTLTYMAADFTPLQSTEAPAKTNLPPAPASPVTVISPDSIINENTLGQSLPLAPPYVEKTDISSTVTS